MDRPEKLIEAARALYGTMSLNTDELTAVLGWPYGDRSYPRIDRERPTVLPLAKSSSKQGKVLGHGTHPGQKRDQLILRTEDALRHVSVTGPTGVGKSTLLLNLALGDIAAGHSVTVFDPKGDLVDDLLARIPDQHFARTVVLDPSRHDAKLIGFNPLASIPTQRHLATDGLVHVFRNLHSGSWGPRTEDILHASLLTQASGVQQAMQRHNFTTRSAVALNVSRSELENCLAEGLSNAEIAEQHGVTTWRITKAIRELGLRRPNAAPQHEAPAESELIHKYVVEQQPIIALSECYGTTHSTVRAWLLQAGVTINESREGTANRRDSDLTGHELHKLYIGEKLTAAEIAAQIGVTKNVVLVMLHSNGIPVRPPGAIRPGHQVPLLDRLYQDSTITDTLKRHKVPTAPGYGSLAERFPKPPELTPALIDDLYHQCGLSTMMMSLLVGYSEAHIRAQMRTVGVALRHGGRSPWMQNQ